MTGIARRTLLRGAAAAALLPLAVGGAVAVAADRPTRAGAGERRALEAAVGSSVRIIGDGGVLTATLHSVRTLSGAATADARAFAAVFHLDHDGSGVLGQGLVDVELPGGRVESVGLVLTDPECRTAVLHVDRRPVSDHLAARHIRSI